MCCTRFAENTGRKNSPSAHHRTILSGYMFATKACIDNPKNMLNGNISFTCPHNMVNFGPLTAENGWRVWGTPSYFNGFRVLSSWQHRLVAQRRSTKLLDDWLVHYIYIFVGSCSLTEFCQVQRFSRFDQFNRGRHLHSAGQPSRLPSTHFLVYLFRKCLSMILNKCMLLFKIKNGGKVKEV